MRLVIDSDGGIDDAAAIAWLLTQPQVEVAAITAVGGNCPVRQAARNLRVIVEAVGASAIPVYVGADPTGPAPPVGRPVLIHGYDGLGDVGFADPQASPDGTSTAAEVLARECRRGSTVLTLGPMTNLAAALAHDPEAPAASAGLVFMGGSARAGGNARPAAEANIAHDPGSAAAVLGAGWARPPVMVGLDVTHQATLRETEFAALDDGATPAAAMLSGPMRYYRRHGGTFCAPGETPCHDLLAAMTVASLDDDPIVRGEALPVEVDTGGGAAWGMTVVDLRELAWRDRRSVPVEGGSDGPVVAGNLPGGGATVAVGLEVDVARFRREVLALAGRPLRP